MTEHEAGRELDALVHEQIMGGTVDRSLTLGQLMFPRYSTDIAAAWLVVEWMVARGWKVDVQNRYAPTWACHVNFAAPDYGRVFEHCETAPLAICRAALVSVESRPLEYPRIEESVKTHRGELAPMYDGGKR